MADAATIAIIVVDLAVALLAAYAAGRLAKKNQQGRDDKPTTVSERGAFVNWFLGLRRLGVVFGWAGLRHIRKESAPGGKGILFGGGPKVPIYYESGLHIISTGIVDELRQIQQNGKVLFQGPITRLTYPSGTTLDLGKEGAFTIYWGDQPDLAGTVPPVDSEVNSWIGVNSRWPLFCRVDWSQKRLGSSANWPAMEYTAFKYCRYSDALLPSVPSYISPTFTLSGAVIPIIGHVNGVEGVGCFTTKADIGAVTTEEGVHYRTSIIKDNDKIQLSGNGMTDGTYTVLKVEVVNDTDPMTFLQHLVSHVFLKGGVIGADDAGHFQLYTRADDDGLNAAHALAELMFAPWPFGLARDPSNFNLTSGGNSLDAAAVLFADEGLKASLLAKDGASAQEVMAGLLQDTGMFITLNTATGLFDFVPIRATDPNDWPEVTLDQLAGTFPEIEAQQGELPQSNVVYGFADRANQFRDMTITIGADGQANYALVQSADNVQMLTIIDFSVAEKIAKRRSQESLAGGAVFRLSGNRTVRELLPGMVVTIEGEQQPVRIISVEIQGDSAEVKIEATSDFMGAKTDETPALSTGAPAGGEASGEILPPLQFDLFQVPSSIAPTTTVVVPQIRVSASVAETTINVSGDDTSYYEKETFSAGQAGGLTTGSAMTAIATTNTPTFDELGPDMETVQDLSSDSASFNAGRQVLMIVSTLGTEICYVDAITSLGAGSWRCNNIIRARQGTTALAHPAGARVYIFDPEQVPSVQDVLLQTGATVYFKPVPGGLTSAEVGSKSLVIA